MNHVADLIVESEFSGLMLGGSQKQSLIVLNYVSFLFLELQVCGFTAALYRN